MSSEPTMIERVARAIYYGKARNKRWEFLQPEFQRQYEKQARAAIGAMRQLPDNIWKLLEEADKDAEWMDSHKAVRHLHNLMIDAALNEHANAR